MAGRMKPFLEAIYDRGDDIGDGPTCRLSAPGVALALRRPRSAYDRRTTFGTPLTSGRDGEYVNVSDYQEWVDSLPSPIEITPPQGELELVIGDETEVPEDK